MAFIPSTWDVQNADMFTSSWIDRFIAWWRGEQTAAMRMDSLLRPVV
jgi:hypothetical protein